MAPPSITIGIGQVSILGEVGQAAPVVQVTPASSFAATDTAGTIEITVSAPARYAGSYVVTAAALAAGPVALVPPSLAAASVVEGGTLDGISGLWAAGTGHPPPVLSYQWRRDGADIPGATGASYTTQTGEAGSSLVLRQTAAQSGTGTASALTGAAAVTGRTVVFGLMGQSNIVGWDPFDGGAGYPAGVLQVARTGRTSGGTEGDLVPAAPLLDHHDGASDHMGPALQFAIDYMAAHPQDTLILVPEGKGSTGLAAGDWTPGGGYYQTAVSRLNTLFAANPAFELGGFLWHQGESDAGTAADAGAYAGALDAMIAQLRSDVTAADAATPFVVGGLVPSWVATDANRQTVQATLAGTPGRVAHTAYADSAGLTPRADGIHFDAASLRSLGSGYFTALAAAELNSLAWQIAGTTIQSFPAVPAPSVSGTIVTAGA